MTVTAPAGTGAGDVRFQSTDNAGVLIRISSAAAGQTWFIDTRSGLLHLAPNSGTGHTMDYAGRMGVRVLNPDDAISVLAGNDKNGIKIQTAVQQPTIRLYGPSPIASTSERNWAWTVSQTSYGDYHLRLSSAASADPLASAGTSPLIFSNAGAATFLKNIVSSGVVDASNATAGTVGEFITASGGAVSVAAAGQYNDIASIALTAGDWEISACIYVQKNGASITGIFIGGIGTVSGNANNGLVAGDTQIEFNTAELTADDANSCIPSFRASISGSQTYYLKQSVTAYTVATPKGSGRISARRIR